MRLQHPLVRHYQSTALILLFLLSCTAHHVSAQQCGSNCTSNNQCTSLECSRCDLTSGTCVEGLSCGSYCNVTTDCNQWSNCTQCLQGVCVQGCGQPCNSSKECEGFSCNACEYGVCVLWRCNVYCTSDAPCQIGGYPGCATCDQTTEGGYGVCKSTCGASCLTPTECPSRCPYCLGGICTVT